MAGYVFSNSKLRAELMKAKDGPSAAKVLGKHLAEDGQTVAKEVQQLAEEHHLDTHVAHGRKYVQKYYKNARDEVQKFLSAKVKDATKVAKKAVSKGKKQVARKMKSMAR